MTERTVASFLVGGFWMLAAGPADADSLRCKNGQIISSGDSLYEVASTCGDPDYREHRVEYQTVRYRVPAPCPSGSREKQCSVVVEETVPVVIDQWTYDFGRNRFVQLVVFEQGKLMTVTTLGYSHKS
jgi:hypothetical protein